MRRCWTHQEQAYLEAHYQKLPLTVLAAALQRTARAVEAKAWMLGLSASAQTWTDAQVDTLRRDYGAKSAKQLARELNKSPNAIYHKLRRIG